MNGRFSGVDGIRGLACLIVLLTHVPGFFFPQTAAYFAGTGKYGVWLFFVLSAFLLTTKFAKTGFSTSVLAGYALGRFLRIIPLFVVVCAIYWVFGAAGIKSYGDFFSAITLQQGYAHLWTIPVEFKFYLLLPFFAFSFIYVSGKFGMVAASLLALVEIVIHQAVWPYWATPENSIATRWYIPSFIFGCYAAVSIDSIRERITSRSASIVAGVVILSLFCLSPGGRNLLAGMPLDRWLMDKYIFLSFLWMFFILVLADGKGMAGRIMKNVVLRRLGAWSYSIYLIHWFFYQGLASVQLGGLFAIGAFVGAIVAGAALFTFIESPIERFRHSLQLKLSPKQPVTA